MGAGFFGVYVLPWACSRAISSRSARMDIMESATRRCGARYSGSAEETRAEWRDADCNNVLCCEGCRTKHNEITDMTTRYQDTGRTTHGFVHVLHGELRGRVPLAVQAFARLRLFFFQILARDDELRCCALTKRPARGGVGIPWLLHTPQHFGPLPLLRLQPRRARVVRHVAGVESLVIRTVVLLAPHAANRNLGAQPWRRFHPTELFLVGYGSG